MRTINRSEVAALRDALRILQLVVAEVDAELRYRWIDSPHPDFAADSVVGKRDDELVPPAEAAEIMDFKRSVIAEGRPRNRILGFHRTDG